MGINHSVEIFRSPRRTDWESFRTDLSDCLRVMPDKINNFTDTEIAAKQFQDAVGLDYNENCPLTVKKNNRNISRCNQDLAEKRRKVRKLFNVANKSGDWTYYDRNLTDYNKELRQAKRESWRRQCEEIEKVPECARLHKILSKDVQITTSSIELENGDHTTEKGTIEELFWVHFPGSEIIF